MKIIEPRRQSPARQHRSRSRSKLARLIVILILVSGWTLIRHQPADAPSLQTSEQAVNSGNTLAQQAASQLPAQFTPEQFRNLYRLVAYPNTQEIVTPPAITSNQQADTRILEVAQKRGYRLSAVPVSPITKLDEKYLDDDDLLQAHAAIAWQELKAAAAKEGIPLTLVSGYRSVDYQRDLFLGRLRALGATNADIAAGRADNLISKVLEVAAPPGYSRHHTGYTIDLACNSIGLHAFTRTACFKWLSADNYLNAKRYGFIPSYPEGASTQGPEAESWEYVWVGQAAVSSK